MARRRIRFHLVAASVVASAALPSGALAWLVDLEGDHRASVAEVFLADRVSGSLILRSRTPESEDFDELRLAAHVDAASVLEAIRPGDIVRLRRAPRSSR